MALPPPPPRPPSPLAPAPARRGYPVNTYDHERSCWGIGDALLAMLVFLVASLGIGIVAINRSGGGGLAGAWLPLAVIGPAVVQLGYVVWIANARGTGLASDFQLRFKAVDLPIGIALGFTGMIAAGLIGVMIIEVFDREPTAAAAEVLRDSEGGNGLTIWIVLFAFLAATLIPLIEELVFRGLWWSALEKRGMHPVAILVITSAVFAVLHLEPLRTAVVFVLGLAIGIGRLQTGRIGPSIAAHAFVNAVSMTALLVELG
jgi:CAAX protease family protein